MLREILQSVCCRPEGELSVFPYITFESRSIDSEQVTGTLGGLSATLPQSDNVRVAVSNLERGRAHAVQLPRVAIILKSRDSRSIGPSHVEYLDRRNEDFGHQLLLWRRSRIIDVIFDAVVISNLDFFLGDNLKNAARCVGQV